jgi:t-SNARE complex subunit (syntaxin)
MQKNNYSLSILESKSESEWTEKHRIDERSDEIIDICHDITTIKEIFTDLALIMETQKKGIETIDKDILNSFNDTQKAIVHLETAAFYQRKGFSLGIGMAIGAIIGGPTGALVGLKMYSFATAVGGSIVGGLLSTF